MVLAEDFATFWAAYPRRTAKLAALNAYGKARKMASAEDILAGVERYKRHLPEEMRYVCHPSTWLNQGRWMDEDDEPAVMSRHECQHDPKCGSKVWCLTLSEREAEGWVRDRAGNWSQAS